jgi:hypothetical protein
MTRPSFRSLRLDWALLIAAITVFVWTTSVAADGWAGDDAAEATAGQLDDHEEGSEDPNDMVVGSRDPNDMVVGSENLDDHEAHSEDPDSMVTGSQQMADHEATSENLADLHPASPDRGFQAIDVPGQSSWESTTDPEILAARENLVRAQQRAASARTAYGDMIRDNYPRGEARLEIVQERDASMQALEKAKRALAGSDD